MTEDCLQPGCCYIGSTKIYRQLQQRTTILKSSKGGRALAF